MLVRACPRKGIAVVMRWPLMSATSSAGSAVISGGSVGSATPQTVVGVKVLLLLSMVVCNDETHFGMQLASKNLSEPVLVGMV